MLVKDQNIAHLRAIVLDERASPSRRLLSLDRMAAEQNLWQTRKVHSDVYVPVGTRARKFAVMALRRLLKSEGFKPAAYNSGLRARLLFLRGISVGNHLYRLDPPSRQPLAPAKPVVKVPDVVRDIEAFLAKHK